MLKRITLTLILVLIVAFQVSVATFAYTFNNLKSYSVYYAQHTPHKPGTEPVLMELTQNLFWVYTPDIDGIDYDFDGGNTIYNSNYKKTTTPVFANTAGKRYYYARGDSTSYLFDKNFQLIVAGNRGRTIDLSTVDVEELKREIYRTVQPVIDAQYAPWINLQWLYDWVNKDKFN